MRDYERFRREQRRREVRIAIVSWMIAGIAIAIGVWAFITLLIWAYG